MRELEEVNRKLVKGELEIGGKRVDLKKITSKAKSAKKKA